MGRFASRGEVVEDVLRVRLVVVDHAREAALEVGIILIEALLNEQRVLVVLGEHDGLGKPVAAVHFLTARHQVLQNLVHGIGVEEPLVDRAGVYLVRDLALFAPVLFLPLLFLGLAQVVVLDALALELERDGHGAWRDEVAVAHGLVQLVGVGGNAALQVKERIGVLVHFGLGRGRQTHEERIEVGEDRAVLLVHTPVRLVNDDQVEVPYPKAPRAGLHVINEAHHGGIGGQEDAAARVLLLHDEVDRRASGKMRFEGIRCLIDEGHAVGEEQDALDPVAALQKVAQGDHGARLARPRRHDHEGLTLVLFERGGNVADGKLLVRAFHDGGVDLRLSERFARRAALDEEFHLVLFVEALHRARRIHAVVPQPRLIPVGVEDEGALPELHLQAVRVQLRLLLPDARVLPGALGFHYGKGQAVVAPEDIVHKALALVVGHSVYGVFAVLCLGEGPAGFAQQEVDEEITGLGFRIVVGVGNGFI